MNFINNCCYRANKEGVCEKNGQYCPEYASQDDLPCGGCYYRESEEEDDYE